MNTGTILPQEVISVEDYLHIALEPAKVIPIFSFPCPDEIYKSLYEKYYVRVKEFAFGHYKRPEDSKDVAQIIFMILWEKRDQLSLIGNMEAYLMTMVKNQFLNAKRKEGRKGAFLKKFCCSCAIHANLTEQYVNARETSRILHNGILKLPPKMRHVLILKKEGYRITEISKQLGIAKPTVKQHLQMATKRMKICLS